MNFSACTLMKISTWEWQISYCKLKKCLYYRRCDFFLLALYKTLSIVSPLCILVTVCSFGKMMDTLLWSTPFSLHRLEFILDNGNLKHVKSGKCVRPKGAVTDGVALGLYSTCAGHQFSFTAGGSLQHVGSKKCVNTRSGVSIKFWSSFPEIWQSSFNFLSSFQNRLRPWKWGV